MLVRILFLILALAAALTHGYRFRHLKKKLQHEIDDLSEDWLSKGGGYRNSRKTVRQKRVSDQRLAELETLIALKDMKGVSKTIPLGWGSVPDPRKIGRKRRSPSVLLDRLFQSMAREEEGDSVGQERPVIQWPPYFWTDDQPE